MKRKIAVALRVLVGLIFVLFDLNFFFNFFIGPEPSPRGMAFLIPLIESGYAFVLLKLVELFAGVFLLMNRFVPLALTMLAPIVLNIFLFHLFLDPKGLPLGIFLLFSELYLAYAYHNYFKTVL